MQARIQKALAKRQAGEGGFTLIELLVVIVIIGILAAIAIPAFLNQREKAWEKAVETDVRNAAMVVETEVLPSGAFDPDLSDTYTAAGNEDSLFKVTEGVSIDVAIDGDANTFTITGTHENLGTRNVVYNSATGGNGTWNE